MSGSFMMARNLPTPREGDVGCGVSGNKSGLVLGERGGVDSGVARETDWGKSMWMPEEKGDSLKGGVTG